MDFLNIFFGVVGIISLVFSIYVYNKSESKKSIEIAKAAIQKERYRNIRFSLLGIYYSVDSIIQIPKIEKASIQQLQHLARNARAQLIVLTKQIEIEQKKIDEWRYGKLIESEIVGPDLPDEPKNDNEDHADNNI